MNSIGYSFLWGDPSLVDAISFLVLNSWSQIKTTYKDWMFMLIHFLLLSVV